MMKISGTITAQITPFCKDGSVDYGRLKALVEESGIEFPVFIDSPLQKFDKSHSSKIITEFYPSISKQVVLFPLLHKELTEDELEIMKPLVKSAYLIKNEVDHSYFQQVPVDKLMND